MEAFCFLDRYEGLSLSIYEAMRRFPSRRLILEFGVYKGQMINFQAKQFPNLEFVGFDSFEGLKEPWKGVMPPGSFSLGGKMPRVRSNVSLIKGWFHQSVPRWKAQQTGEKVPLLIHIDCDTYEATFDTLSLCTEYVQHGVIMHFDDYFGFPNWRNGGYKALSQIAEQKGWNLTYLSYGTKEVALLAEKGSAPGY
jgi:hypothetical protein